MVSVVNLAIEHVPDYQATSDAAMKLLHYLDDEEIGNDHLPLVCNILRYCMSLALIDIRFILRLADGFAAEGRDLTDVNAINQLTASMADDGDREQLDEFFRPIAFEIVRERIVDEVHQRESLSGFFDEDDLSEAKASLETIVSEIFREVGMSPSCFEIREVVNEVDIIDIINNNIERSGKRGDEYNSGYGRGGGGPGDDKEIDELFSIDTPPAP